MINLKPYKYRQHAVNQRGFTLIELLISISILSLLLFTGAYTYRLMSDRWDKELGQFSTSALKMKNLENLQRLLEGVQSFVVVDKNKKPSFFFIGGETSLLAVSRAGLFSGDYPEVFRLTAQHKKGGLVDLIYQSVSTQALLLTGTEQEISFTKQLVILTDIDKISFRYFGWENLDGKGLAVEQGKHQQWYEKYSGIDNQLMPEALIITITQSGHDLSFPVNFEVDAEHWLSPYFEDQL